jgi:superfamily II DNA or RNA helicase
MPSSPPHKVIVADLASAHSREQAEVQQAALEWSILAPIIIRCPEDVKSRVKWSADLTPFIHQYENLYTFCRRLPVSLIADDVGLGKTISAGLILSELMTRQRVRRTLVLCPKILCHQWQSELQAKFGIDAHACSGTNDLKAAIRGRHSVVITTNHSALQVLPTLPNDAFEMLILDEAHKLRNLHGTNAPPQIALRIRDALKNHLFNFVVMLTATPLHNRLWDIYSLVDLLALGRNHANPFGDPDRFRARFIDERYEGDRVIQRGREAEFRGIVRDYMVRTRRLDAKLPFPSRVVQNTELSIPANETKLFDYVGSILNQLGPLEQASVAKALLSSPQALALQMENMSRSRPQFSAAAAKLREFADHVGPTAKLQRLGHIVDELKAAGGKEWRLLVFTERTETQRAIGDWLMSKGIRLGFIRGGQAAANQKAIDAFQADPPGINCIISTDAGSEGVNLQACSYLVNFDLPWNPMIVEQRIGRIQRLSSKYENVVVTNLVLKHPADAHVVGLLMQKLAAIANAVDDIESVLEDMSQGAEGDGQRFEDTVRDLVVKALMRQDVSDALEQIQENIRLAETKKREQEEEIDEIFGATNAAAHKDIRPPDLAYPDPSLDADEFVLAAKRLEGRLEQGAGKTWVHRPDTGLPEQFSFSREEAEASAGVFGRRIEHYDAGTPPFQRLVGRWATDHHVIEDRTCSQPELLHATVALLLKPRSHLRVSDVRVVGRRHTLDAGVLVRAQAANGVDRYEKLIRVGDPAIEPDDSFPVKSAALKPQDLPEDVVARARAAVERDADIQKFLDYYGRKHDQEAERAAGDRTRLSRLAANYTPKLESKIVSAWGVQVARLDVEVDYSVDGEGAYTSAFSFDTRQLAFTAQPAWSRCEVTGHIVPADALAACEVSGTEACRHFMAISAVSGKAMLPEHAVTCAVSGAVLLPQEAGASDVSGLVVDARLLIVSAMSDRQGVESEVVQCHFTGDRVLSDEIAASDLSGKMMRKDHAVTLGDDRVAHESEVQRCSITNIALPPEELGRSDVNGKYVLKSLLVTSSVPPYRCGVESDLLTCAVSGRQALVDEIVISAVSAKPCLPECAVKSDQSGRLALPDEVVTCVASGRTLLPDEVVVSAISGSPVERGQEARSAVSERICAPREAVICGITGVTVLPDEVAVSEVSGQQFRMDEAVRLGDGRLCHVSESLRCAASDELIAAESSVQSSVSGARARRDLLVQCEESGVLALPAELETSVVSGKRVIPSLLLPSPVSGRKALDSEFVECEITAAPVLPDEILSSELSGRKFRRDEAATLGDGRTVHRSESRKCEATGLAIGVSEGSHSDVSGKWVHATCLVASDKSGRKGLPSETRRCEVTGRQMLEDEVSISSTGRVGDAELLSHSDLSGNTAFPDELVECAVSGRKGLANEMRRSDVSGKVVDPSLLVKSATSSRRGLKDECVNCDVGGETVLADETVVSDVSGKTVARDSTVVDDEGHRGHKSEFARCSRTKRLLPRTRVRPSDVSGIYVDESLLVTSEKTVTRRGLPEETATCSITGKRLLQDEVDRSDASGRIGDKDLILVSPKLKKRVFATELVTCAHTGQQLLPEEMETSQYSGARAAPEAMLTSSMSARRGLPAEFGTCDFTNMRCLLDELARSEVSGRMYRVDQQATHADGRRGHASEFRTCAHSQRVLLPSEGGVSDVSGQWAATEHLVSSELATHRRGLISETVRCCVTGKLLLRDEAATSDLSGRQGDRDRLVQSPASRLWGFTDEMVQCSDSGDWFGVDETGECAVSKKRVDKRLLSVSEVSGKSALKEYMATCGVSGEAALAQELETCSHTGTQALPRFLGWCCATNAWVLLKHLVECSLPQGLILDDDAHRVRSKSGRVCARRFARRCFWTGHYALPDEGEACQSTGLWFSEEWLRDGECSLLHDAVTTHDRGAWRACNELKEWVAPLLAQDGTVRSLSGLLSPDGHRQLLVAEFTRWPWQPERRAVLVVLPQHRKLLGRAVIYTLRGREWTRETSRTGVATKQAES